MKRWYPSEKELDLSRGWCMPRKPCHNDPLMGTERETEEVCETLIGRDQGVAMGGRVTEDTLIRHGSKTQIANVIDRVSSLPQGDTRRTRQIGIQEESNHLVATRRSSPPMIWAA